MTTFPLRRRPSLRRLLAWFSTPKRVHNPLDDALCAELQSMRHETQLLRLRELRRNPHLARDMGFEPDADPCPPRLGPGGTLL